MIKQGRVYISLPPLYCWGKSAKDYGWCNKVEDIPATAKDVHRFKGLGEMNNDQLEYFLVDKNTRHVMQIEYPSDIDEFNKILGTSEGKGELLRGLGLIVSE
jgi:DNA gyrase/topoisomerase IV subunit B